MSLNPPARKGDRVYLESPKISDVNILEKFTHKRPPVKPTKPGDDFSDWINHLKFKFIH